MAADPLSRVFSALADPTRRDIVARLAVADATVNELAEPYDVSVQAVSKHLKVLEEAGLVSRPGRRGPPTGAPRGGGVRPDDQVDRALPAPGRGALPPPRRRAPGHARPRIPTPPFPHEQEAHDDHHRTHETEITVDPDVPLVRITREFDAPVAEVFRAHVDPELVVQWLGPRRHEMHIDHYDCRTGGSYRYVHASDGDEYGFHGCFHEVRPSELIVQTFTFEGMPDEVALERLVFEDLGDGRTRLVGDVARRQLREPRRVRGQRHGGRRPRGLRAPRRAARRVSDRLAGYGPGSCS